MNREQFYLGSHPTLSTSWVIYREGKLLIKRFDSFWDDSQTIAKFLEPFSNRIDCLSIELHAFSCVQYYWKISIFFFSSLSEIHAKLTREKFYEGMRNEKNFEAICAYIYLKKTFVALIEKQLYYVNGRKHNSSLFC